MFDEQQQKFAELSPEDSNEIIRYRSFEIEVLNQLECELCFTERTNLSLKILQTKN